MTALAHRVVLSVGWRRGLIAWAAGAVAAGAMPPFGLWPALLVSLTVATWLLDGAAGRGALRTAARAAATGWLWGFGFFTAGLWWIGSAFLVEADVFAWLMPFGVLGLPAVLAVFPAFGFALARAFWSPGAARILGLAFGLSVSEWLRGHAFTGFPWNSLGLAFGQNSWLGQTASLIGMEGLTGVAVLVGAAPAALGTALTPRGRIGPPAAAALLVALMALFGLWRLPAGPVATVPGIRLRLLQPNLPQDAKFRPSAGPEILKRYLALSGRATGPDRGGLADVTHLVWPESAFPFLLNREPAALGEISRALPAGTVLLTGAAREGDALPGESGRRFFNAIQVVTASGAIVADYDKVHLVPFGEYVPAFLDRALRGLGLQQFVHIPGGFTAGTLRRPLIVPGLPPVAASVCYEAIFPDEVLPEGDKRPEMILNVTNDGWFGDTPGPRQHLAQAVLRAVEQGLPLVRAANTGISAIVDPYGRMLASLDVGREGVVDGPLPVPLRPTIFARYGKMIVAFLVISCMAGAMFGRVLARRR